MSLTAANIRQLAALGLTAEQVAGVAEIMAQSGSKTTST